MRIIYLFTLFVSSLAFGQISLSTNSLDFGWVNLPNSETKTVQLSNTSNQEVKVVQMLVADSNFRVTESNIVIPANDSKVITIEFKPAHNLNFTSSVVMVLDNGNEYAITIEGKASLDDPYYANTQNKSNESLKQALTSIVSSGYVNLGYTGARDKMYADIDNVNGKVTCVYTGRQASFTTRSGANSNSFNCEHTWPQSLFNKNEPERADIHHLFPTDVTSNSRRSSYPFGVVSSASWSQGGSKQGVSLFEPRNAQKGATARAMLYFTLRYTDYGNFIDNQEELLKNWHLDHLPTQAEKTRNEKIYGYQKNRNPFVDYPQFASRINKFGSVDNPTPITASSLAQDVIDYGKVTTSEERYFHLLNSGTTNWEISEIFMLNNNTINAANGEKKPGETAKITYQFNGLATGIYSDDVKLKLQNGSSKSVTVKYEIVSGGDFKLESSKFSVNYDQATQKLSLVDLPQDAFQLEIFTIGGKRIYLNEISNSFTDIDLSQQSSGLYFVVVKSKLGAYSSKFLIY